MLRLVFDATLRTPLTAIIGDTFEYPQRVTTSIWLTYKKGERTLATTVMPEPIGRCQYVAVRRLTRYGMLYNITSHDTRGEGAVELHRNLSYAQMLKTMRQYEDSVFAKPYDNAVLAQDWSVSLTSDNDHITNYRGHPVAPCIKLAAG